MNTRHDEAFHINPIKHDPQQQKESTKLNDFLLDGLILVATILLGRLRAVAKPKVLPLSLLDSSPSIVFSEWQSLVFVFRQNNRCASPLSLGRREPRHHERNAYPLAVEAKDRRAQFGVETRNSSSSLEDKRRNGSCLSPTTNDTVLLDSSSIDCCSQYPCSCFPVAVFIWA